MTPVESSLEDFYIRKLGKLCEVGHECDKVLNLVYSKGVPETHDVGLPISSPMPAAASAQALDRSLAVSTSSVGFKLWTRDLVFPFDFYMRLFFGSMHISVARSTHRTIVI